MRFGTHPGPFLFAVYRYNISRSFIPSKYVYPCALHRRLVGCRQKIALLRKE